MNAKEYPNETMRLLFERASCRSFQDRKIPDDVMKYILEAGLKAPTGGNIQPYSIIKIEKDEAKNRLAELCERQMFIADAPVNLIFCIDWHRMERWAALEAAPFTAAKSFRHFWISFQDTIICAQNICTAADAMGLGSVYVGTVLECFRELKKMLELPEGVLPVVLLSLGYPKSQPKPRRKLGVEAMVHDEKYQELSDERLLELMEEKYPGVSYQANEENLKRLKQVCQDVGGPELAEKCLTKVREQGFINQVQRYFGLHYVANEMPQGNADYMKVMEEYGFDWFKEYKPSNSTKGEKQKCPDQ